MYVHSGIRLIHMVEMNSIVLSIDFEGRDFSIIHEIEKPFA